MDQIAGHLIARAGYGTPENIIQMGQYRVQYSEKKITEATNGAYKKFWRAPGYNAKKYYAMHVILLETVHIYALTNTSQAIVDNIYGSEN